MTRDDGREEIVECSSPPCMLEELHFRTGAFVSSLVKEDILQTWAEVPLWRSSKRKILIEQRVAISTADRANHNAKVSSVLGQILEAIEGKLVGFYWPFKAEYDPRPLVRLLQAKGMRFALPVVIAKDEPMIFREWKPGISMSQGVWNIPFPSEGRPVAPDVLLVPLVGFDRHCFRLGYGGGYYDRTIAAAPIRPQTIGVGHDRLELATIHPRPHDIKMDSIVTERGVVYGSSPR
jgi:5-formyltetrahydrofolate cyclo-ligase